MHHFNGHFAGKPWFAGCQLDFQPPVMLILSILIIAQAKTLHTILLELGRWSCPQVLWSILCPPT